MSSLTNPCPYVLSEIQALRVRREALLREADKHRYRLHRLRSLQTQIQQATTDLLELELEHAVLLQAASKAPKCPEPLGDAGVVGGGSQGRLPYKD
ncbi:gas vesicle protein V [Roseibium porphyridii]|uniref:Gas vesicle protein V n=1 Tax=Roseibium porphyridii TaxID=2866279 RepID=A0ABY8FAP0_9HYPH|nr:gas vesicle protein V [Roseibium sp. KMA01]WFE92286.1 gas vesicle protein V [Roseibium sp. KMA01]